MAQAWPSQLQERLAEINFAMEFGETTITSTVDSGLPKKRAIYTKGVDVFSGAIYLTIPEYRIFETFYKTTLGNGVLTFDYNHPITQDPSIFRFRERPTFASLGGGMFTASFTWELVPQ